MKFRNLILLISLFSVSFLSAQSITLQECIDQARANNMGVKIAAQSMETRQQQYEGSKKNKLPNIDLLAGYNYIGKPLRLDMGQTKDGIVDGTSHQITNAAGILYEDITGSPMGDDLRNQIYNTSHDIISAAYPNYNPEISKQSFFTAGLLARQPIYLGGKLNALQELKRQEWESGKVLHENSQELAAYQTILEYIQVMYYNSMIEKQQESLTALRDNHRIAQSLIKAEVLPPYQLNWVEVALSQAETVLDNLKLNRENSLTTLKDIMGIPLNEELTVDEKLPEDISAMPFLPDNNGPHNADIRILQSKKEEAGVALKVAKSAHLPNIFAIGNVQLIKSDLPVITPPWLVGVEMQWTLFNGFKTQNNIRAAESLISETDLLIQQKQKAVNLGLKLAENKINAIQNQSETLDKARKQTYTTTDMVKLRLENILSSVKDVNDALQLQFTAEKLYYASLVAYQVATSTYYFLKGDIYDYPQTINR